MIGTIGPAWMPVGLAGAALLSLALTAVLARRPAGPRRLAGVAGAAVVIGAIVWSGLFWAPMLAAFAFLLVSRPLRDSLGVAFGNLVAARYDPQAAKKAFPRLAATGQVGAICAGLMLPLLLRLGGARAAVIAWPLLALAALSVAWRLPAVLADGARGDTRGDAHRRSARRPRCVARRCSGRSPLRRCSRSRPPPRWASRRRRRSRGRSPMPRDWPASTRSSARYAAWRCWRCRRSGCRCCSGGWARRARRRSRPPSRWPPRRRWSRRGGLVTGVAAQASRLTVAPRLADADGRYPARPAPSWRARRREGLATRRGGAGRRAREQPAARRARRARRRATDRRRSGVRHGVGRPRGRARRAPPAPAGGARPRPQRRPPRGAGCAPRLRGSGRRGDGGDRPTAWRRARTTSGSCSSRCWRISTPPPPRTPSLPSCRTPAAADDRAARRAGGATRTGRRLAARTLPSCSPHRMPAVRRAALAALRRRAGRRRCRAAPR